MNVVKRLKQAMASARSQTEQVVRCVCGWLDAVSRRVNSHSHGMKQEVVVVNDVSSYFPDWEKFVVFQKYPDTGCVAAGYEYLLRANGVSDIANSNFQETLQRITEHLQGGSGVNMIGLNGMRGHIWQTYRSQRLPLCHKRFGQGEGDKKVAFIEEVVRKRVPIVVTMPVAATAQLNFHVMPVIDMDDSSFTFYYAQKEDGSHILKNISKQEVRDGHDESAVLNQGDVAWFGTAEFPCEARGNYR